MTADIFPLLGQMTVAASAAILLMLIGRRMLRRVFGPGIAYAFWLIVPLAVLGSLMPTELVFTDAMSRDAGSIATTVPERLVPEGLIPEGMQLQSAQSSLASGASTARSDSAPAASSLMVVGMIGLWGAGFLISLLVQVSRHRLYLKRHNLTRWAGRVLRAQSEDASPAVVGVFNPSVVLPNNFSARFNRLERKLILAHERSHIVSGDVPVNALAILIKSLFWFNPLAYMAHDFFRVDQELACDARVMRKHGQHRRTYAETLLKSQLMVQTSPIGCAWLPKSLHPLKERVARLSGQPLGAARRYLGFCAVLVVATLSSTVSWAALSSHSLHVPVGNWRAAADASNNDEREFDREDKYDLQDAQGASLVYALLDRRYNHARALIDAGADVNYGLRGDGTPLIVAVRDGNRDIMELLLEKGADPDGYVSGDGTALVVAAQRGNIDAARYLIEAGADVNKAAPGDGNPLIMAARRGNLEMVKMLVQSGADVNGFVLGDETPLIGAARQGEFGIAEYLIEQGADVNLRVPTGNGEGRAQYRSPLGQARLKGHSRMAKLLRDAGAEPVTERED